MSDDRLSGNLVFLRYVLPALWIVIVGTWIAQVGVMVLRSDYTRALGLLAPMAFFIAIAVLFYRKLVWELADEVVLRGETLHVRRRGVEQRIRLADVVNVDCWKWVNPQRVTLRLRQPGPFGPDVAFAPRMAFHLNPFARHPVAELLIERVDAARRKEMA